MQPQESQPLLDPIQIQLFKNTLQRLSKFNLLCLQAPSSNCVITLVIPPTKPMVQVRKMLRQQRGYTASIKDRTTRNKIEQILTISEHRLRRYSSTPPKGLMLFCGYIPMGNNCQRKILIDIQPPFLTKLRIYHMERAFQLSQILQQLEVNDDPPFLYIMVRRLEAWFVKLTKNVKEVFEKATIAKAPRGGKSSVRFFRLSTQVNAKKVGQQTEKVAIKNGQCQFTAVVIGTRSAYINQLSFAGNFDARTQSKITKIFQIGYQQEPEFETVYELARESFSELLKQQQATLLNDFFSQKNLKTGLAISGISSIIDHLLAGSVRILICSSDLDFYRVVVGGHEKNAKYIGWQELDMIERDAQTTGIVIESEPILMWMASHYREYGAQLKIISADSVMGSQFLKELQGVGAFLKYPTNQSLQSDNGATNSPPGI